MNKLKSPVYLCFLGGGLTSIAGFATLLLGDVRFGSRHWLSHIGMWLLIAGVALYAVPLLGSLAWKCGERLHQRWRKQDDRDRR